MDTTYKITDHIDEDKAQDLLTKFHNSLNGKRAFQLDLVAFIYEEGYKAGKEEKDE